MTFVVNDAEYTVLGVELSVDQLVDIVNHGMKQGVSGFIYTQDLITLFNDEEDYIMDYLNNWAEDVVGAKSIINWLTVLNVYDSIDQLKQDLVWHFVELKAHDILTELNHPAVY